MKEGWEYKTLGEICKIYNGNSINADYKKKHFLGATGGLPFIATKDVSPLGTIDYNNGVRIPNYEEFKVAPANSVFICAEGGSAGKKFAYVEKDVCFGNKLFCITPKDKAIKGKFIYHFVQSDNFRGQFFSLLTGLIGGVSAKKFQTIEIPVPSLSEQQSIVDYLDSAFAKIDAMKANAEKALNEAKALFQASLKEMLEPKEGWEEKKLCEVVNIINGYAFPSKAFGDNQELKVVKITNVGVGSFIEDISTLPQKMFIQDVCLKEGDIVIALTRTIISDGLKRAIIPSSYDGAMLNQRVASLRYCGNINMSFLYYYLGCSTVSDYVWLHVNTLMQPNLSIKDLKNLPVCNPPLSEQQSIVATLDSLKSKVDRLQENYEKISQECDALKQAILKQVFE